MTDKRQLTCINCPLGCTLSITIEDGQIKSISGNSCKRGEKYAIKEVSTPSRTVTSTVSVIGGVRKVVSVRTNRDIPKAMIFDSMEEINNALVMAPVEIGKVIIEDVCGSGADVIATANVKKK